jgi:spermidine dehydrogenase
MNGGTLNIEGPSQYSPEAMGLLKEIGVDTARYYKAAATAEDHYRSLNLNPGTFFDRETFGEDRLVLGSGQLPWAEFLDQTPLSERAKKDIVRLYRDNTDYMSGLSLI